MSSPPLNGNPGDLLRWRFDADAAGRAILDDEGHWILVNRSLCVLLGSSAEELLGRTWDATLNPEHVGSFADLSRKPPESRTAEVRFVRPDGRTVTARVSLSAFASPDAGEVFHEATVRETVETATDDGIWQMCNRYSRELIGASFDLILVHQDGRIVSIDDAGLRLLGVASPAEVIGRQISDFVVPEGRGEAAARIRQQIQNSKVPPRYVQQQFLKPAGAVFDAECLRIPILHDGRPAIMLLVRDISDRILAERDLAESEHWFRALAELSPVGIYRTDSRGCCLYVNPTWCRLSGMTPEEAAGEGWQRGLHPGDRDRISDLWARHSDDLSPWSYEYRFLTPGGKITWVTGSSVALRNDQDRIIGFLGVNIDITERKAAEEARRLADERYRRIVETANEGIWVTDDRHRTTFVNPQMAAMLGCTPEEMLGRNTESFMPEEELRDHAEQMRLRHQGGSSRYERRFLYGDGGRVIWTSISGAPIIDPEGRFAGAFAMVTDITEQKKAETELKEREGFLNHVLTANPGLIYIYDLVENRNIYANRALTDFLGYTAEEVHAMGSKLFARILHPDDAESVARHHAQLARSSDDLTMDLEYRMLASDGSWRWLRSRDMPFNRDQDGACRQILGFALDVTEQHRSEEELRRSRTHLEEAQRVAGVGSWEWDMASGTIFWSEELYRLNRRDPCLGPPSYQEMLQMYEPEYRLALQELVEAGVKEGRSYDLEYRRVFPDGSIRHYLAKGNVGRDERGAVNRIYGTVLDVTERKRRELELRFNAAIFQNIPDGILLIGTRDGLIKYANERFETIFGYERGELIGRDVAILNAPTDKAPEETKAELTRQVLETGEWHGEILNIRKDGTPFWSYAHVAVCDHPDFGQVFLSVLSDITQQKQTEEVLRQNRHFLDRILETSPNLVYIYDLQERSNVYANRGTLEFLGYTPEQIRDSGSRLFARILHPEDVDRVAEHQRRFDSSDSGQIFEVEYRMLNAAGEWRWLRSRDVLFSRTPDGHAREILGVAEDFTARKKADLERTEMEHRLLEAQKLESLGVMAGGIAHDFNNLLMAILGNLEISLDDTPAGSSARPGIEQAIQATVKAAALTDQMLAYAGHGSTNPVLIDLNLLVREHAPLFRTAVFRTVGLTLDLSPDPATVEVDVGQIQQVVMNLVTNASESLDGKSGEIRICTRTAECDQAFLDRSRLDDKPPAGRYVCLEVTDNGCGMDESTLQRIFDPFFTTKFTGRGLGMAAVLGIVRAHRGAIMVDSHPGKGTTVTILLPSQSPAESAGPTVAPGRDEAQPMPSGTVLVVDDEEPVRNMLMAYLHRLGFQTLGAADGEEAVAVFRAHADDIVCVFMDLTMPRRNGVEAAADLRALRPGVPVILCSGFDEVSARNLYGDYGVTDFIKKPCSLADLKRKISSTLKQ